MSISISGTGSETETGSSSLATWVAQHLAPPASTGGCLGVSGVSDPTREGRGEVGTGLAGSLGSLPTDHQNQKTRKGRTQSILCSHWEYLIDHPRHHSGVEEDCLVVSRKRMAMDCRWASELVRQRHVEGHLSAFQPNERCSG